MADLSIADQDLHFLESSTRIAVLAFASASVPGGQEH